jgi:integration host factor subunit alpha
LAAGDNVKLAGFGCFIVRNKAERIGRNPKTGVEVPITPRQVIMFRSSPVLTIRINGEASDRAL